MFKNFQFTLFFIRDFITQNKLQDLYQQLKSYYQQAQSSYSPELEQNINNTRDQIFLIHNQINYASWSAPKISILKRIDAYKLIGSEVVKRINGILSKGSGNVSAIVQHLEELISDTNQIESKTQQLIQGMNLEEEIEKVEEGKQIVEVSFEGNASLLNFWELKDRSNEWSFIIRTFTRLTGEDYKSARIISLNTASPEAGACIEAITKTAQAIITAAKAAAELKKLKDKFFSNKKDAEKLPLGQDTLKMVVKDLEINHEDGYKKRIGELSLEISQNHGVNQGDHEVENMVGIALEKMTTLIGDGVKVLDPSEVKVVGAPDVSSLGSLYADIKKIDKEAIPLLEAENQKRLEERDAQMKEELDAGTVGLVKAEVDGENKIDESVPITARRGVGRPKKEKIDENLISTS